MVLSSKASMSNAVKLTDKSTVNATSKHAVATSNKLVRTAQPLTGTKTSTRRATAEPSLRFFLSQELRDKTDQVLTALETRPDHSSHGGAMADLVNELIEAGMDYYFLKA